MAINEDDWYEMSATWNGHILHILVSEIVICSFIRHWRMHLTIRSVYRSV